jgi:hypothetical protein
VADIQLDTAVVQTGWSMEQVQVLRTVTLTIPSKYHNRDALYGTFRSMQ